MMQQEHGLLCSDVALPDSMSSPLALAQAGVVYRHSLAQLALSADALKHDYLSHDGSKA